MLECLRGFAPFDQEPMTGITKKSGLGQERDAVDTTEADKMNHADK